MVLQDLSQVMYFCMDSCLPRIGSHDQYSMINLIHILVKLRLSNTYFGIVWFLMSVEMMHCPLGVIFLSVRSIKEYPSWVILDPCDLIILEEFWHIIQVANLYVGWKNRCKVVFNHSIICIVPFRDKLLKVITLHFRVKSALLLRDICGCSIEEQYDLMAFLLAFKELFMFISHYL